MVPKIQSGMYSMGRTVSRLTKQVYRFFSTGLVENFHGVVSRTSTGRRLAADYPRIAEASNIQSISFVIVIT